VTGFSVGSKLGLLVLGELGVVVFGARCFGSWRIQWTKMYFMCVNFEKKG